MNIFITGGTGFIGSHLRKLRPNNNYIILSRQKHANTIQHINQIAVDTQIDVIINLAGAPINCRWTQKNCDILLESRLNATMECGHLMVRLKNKPKLMLSASAIGYYGSHDDQILTEDSPYTPEFTHHLCQKWEEMAQKIGQDHNIPTSILRFGVVLAGHGGAFPQMAMPIKLGIGGKIGTGRQFLSWIYIDDAIHALDHIINKNLSGIFNITAPNPVTNWEFTQILAKHYHRPSFLPLPAGVVKLLFGEMGGALLLRGQRVYPKALLDSGFAFQYPTLQHALQYL